jgi:hypothetical protein
MKIINATFYGDSFRLLDYVIKGEIMPEVFIFYTEDEWIQYIPSQKQVRVCPRIRNEILTFGEWHDGVIYPVDKE